MSDLTRREALTQLAAAFAAAGVADRLLATEVHAQVPVPVNMLAPRALSGAQFRTLQCLTDLIVPAENGRSGAILAGVPGWIDSLLNVNADLKARYAAGLGWLDQTMQAQHGSSFADASPEQQTAILDVIAFQKNRTPDNTAAVDFFILARRMTVDGFYTSDVGILDINPGGRPPHGTFTVPQEDVDYVISHSPFRQGA